MNSPEHEVDSSRWTGAEPDPPQGQPPRGAGPGEAATVLGVILTIVGADGAIRSGMRLGAAFLIVVGVGLIVLGLRHLRTKV
jgi:hypothetical protein